MLRAIGPRPMHQPPKVELGTRAVIGGAFESPRIFRVMRESSRGFRERGRTPERSGGAPSERSGGSRPRIAVVLSSKANTDSARKAYFRDTLANGKIDPVPSIRRWFIGHGFEPVYIPLTVDRAEVWSHDRRLAELIGSCDAVYLAGGDQAKHVRSLLEKDGGDTPVMSAIRSVAEKGGLVSGSSAGAAAQGGLQYGGGDVYRYLVENRLIERDTHAGTLHNEHDPDIGSLQRGLSVLSDDVLVCTHFDQRHRLGRLLVALRASGQRFGIGVDEDTALFARGAKGKVIGSHGAFVIDPSEAKYGEGPHFSVEGLRLTYLTHGDRIDLDTLEAAPDKRRLPPPKAMTISKEDILSPMRITEWIETMVRSGADRAIATTEESEPRFLFELISDRRTRTYDDGKQVSATNLILNVRPL